MKIKLYAGIIIASLVLLAGCGVVDPVEPDDPIADPLKVEILTVEVEYPYVTVTGCIEGGVAPYAVAYDCDTTAICPPGNLNPCVGQVPCPPCPPEEECCFEFVCDYSCAEGDYLITLTVVDDEGESVVRQLDITIEKPIYTVEFVDYDGALIASRDVKHGDNAVPPADPKREGYEFVGWDTDYTDVTEDLTVTAVYEEEEEEEETPPGPPNGPPGPLK